jgi:hypothetical protein
MFTFKARYFIAFILLLVIEILIALYVHDSIIRPYIGDYLVVILLYCLLRSFVKISVVPAAISVLLFSYILEILQYFHVVELLGLQNSTLASTIIGTSFAWIDLLAYTAGIATVLLTDRILLRNK